jgi:hypothetical protein
MQPHRQYVVEDADDLQALLNSVLARNAPLRATDLAFDLIPQKNGGEVVGSEKKA